MSSSTQSMTALMRRTKAELAEEVLALRRQASEPDAEGTAAQLAQALIESEERLKTFVDNIPAIITLKDADGRILLANKHISEMRGLAAEDMIGKTVHDLETKELADRLTAQDQATLAKGAPLEFEFKTTIASGMEHDYLGIRFPVFGSTGDMVGIGSVNLDITERKQAEADLRDLNDELERRVEERTRALGESESRLKAFLDNAIAPMTLKDLDGKFLLVNKVFADNRGMDPDALIGTTAHDIYPKATARRMEDQERQILETGEPIAEEIDVVTNDGATHLYLLTKFPLFDAAGAVVAIGGISTDITELKKAEAEIQEQREILENIFENIAQGLAAYDENARVITWNKKYQDYLEFDDDHIYTGCPLRDLVVIHAERGTYGEAGRENLEARVQERIDQLMSGEVVHFEYVNINGVPLEAVSAPRPQGGFVITYADVSERKQAEAEIIRARDAAESANRAKSEFLSSMSHELRTPLNAIIGYSEFVAEDTEDPLTDEQRECVDQVMRAGRHLLNLIDEVLDLSRIESGTMTLSLEPVDVADVVAECVELTTSMAARRGIDIGDGVTGRSLPPIQVDRTRLKQVLLNFLSNAVKYNRENGSIAVACTETGEDRIRISVTDTGPGIDSDGLANLFDPFNRLGAENSDIEGTGIGLTITQRLVAQMGGEIGVDSTVGTGSTFWITFPVAKGGIATGVRVQPATAEPPAGHAGRVLYIEDNPANVQLLGKILERHNRFQVMDAPTAEVGLEMARQHQPDVIVMDINLPGMDGLAAIAALRALPETSHIPVIALSAAAQPRDIATGQAAGFAGYLTKPIDADALIGAIEAAIA